MMFLPWEIVSREFKKYFSVCDLLFQCKWNYSRFSKLMNENFDKDGLFRPVGVGGVSNNLDLNAHMAMGAALQQGLFGIAGLAKATVDATILFQKTKPRPFFYAPGSHEKFKKIAGGERIEFTEIKELEAMMDVSRGLSFVFDRELMKKSIFSLIRAERLMQLMDILLLESKRCGGPRHPFTEAVGSLRTAGVDPWTDNREGLSEDAALAILSKASNEAGWRPRRSVPIPRDFGKFFEAHPTWDGFALILLWKAQRLEAALHEIDRGLLHEAWSCPTPSEAPDPVESEREATWDWLTEKETATIIRRGSRFPGRGHPAVDKLGLRVREEEVVRRATTEELPPEFSNIAPTFVELPPFEIDQILTDSRILDRQALRISWEKQVVSQQIKEIGNQAVAMENFLQTNKGAGGENLNALNFNLLMEEPPIFQIYGGKPETVQAIFEEKDVLPMFQLLRTVDMGDWWKKALEMQGSSGTGLTPELG